MSQIWIHLAFSIPMVVSMTVTARAAVLLTENSASTPPTFLLSACDRHAVAAHHRVFAVVYHARTFPFVFSILGAIPFDGKLDLRERF